MIRFFDERGIDLSESDQRRVERMYHREEFRRVTAGDIGDIDFSPARDRALHGRRGRGVRAAQRRPSAEVKLVLDLSYGAASFVMPNLLAKVGADVLSINPYAQTPGMISVDRIVSEARVADAVRGSGADLGAVIDAGGERLTLIDGTGRVLSDDEALMVFIELLTACRRRRRASRCRSRRATGRRALCAARGVEVVLTPLSPSGLARGGRGRAASPSPRTAAAGYVFPGFLPAFDAAAALARLVSLLGQRLGHPRRDRRGHAADADRARGGGDALRAQGPRHAHSHGAADRGGGRAGAGRRHQGALRGGLGPRGARPRGPGHPRLGRGGRPCRRRTTLAAAYVDRIQPGALTSRPACGELRLVAGVLYGRPPWTSPATFGTRPSTSGCASRATRVRVGITDYAQDALGDIVFVDLPAVGSTVEAGGQIGEVESTKSVSEIYAPLAGHGDRGQRRAAGRRPSASTRIPTAKGGSASSSSRRGPIRPACSTPPPTPT